MIKRVALFLVLSFVFFSCKKSTSYQIVFYNDSNEQLKVKVYSPLLLEADSFIVNSLSQHEVYFKKEDGINNSYACVGTVDSVFTYSVTNKMKVKVNKASVWTAYDNTSTYTAEHQCTLYIGKGDTLK